MMTYYASGNQRDFVSYPLKKSYLYDTKRRASTTHTAAQRATSLLKQKRTFQAWDKLIAGEYSPMDLVREIATFHGPVITYPKPTS